MLGSDAVASVPAFACNCSTCSDDDAQPTRKHAQEYVAVDIIFEMCSPEHMRPELTNPLRVCRCCFCVALVTLQDEGAAGR